MRKTEVTGVDPEGGPVEIEVVVSKKPS
jgi:hypothetical protein